MESIFRFDLRRQGQLHPRFQCLPSHDGASGLPGNTDHSTMPVNTKRIKIKTERKKLMKSEANGSRNINKMIVPVLLITYGVEDQEII
jgi:hypothetical protein